MPRTNSTLVTAILDEEPDKPLGPYISAANKLVTQCCAPNPAYDDDYLQEIETWLAAHVYTQPFPQVVMEQASSTQESFQNKIEIGLQNSRYGQFVLRLDWFGGLAQLDALILSKQIKAKTTITWLGTPKG